jgi:hypothetical protein
LQVKAVDSRIKYHQAESMRDTFLFIEEDDEQETVLLVKQISSTEIFPRCLMAIPNDCASFKMEK